MPITSECECQDFLVTGRWDMLLRKCFKFRPSEVTSGGFRAPKAYS